MFNILNSSIEKINFSKCMQSLRIVYYHRVNNYTNNLYYFSNPMTLGIFKKQLNLFQKNYNVISLSEARFKALQGDYLGDSLVITFDDGFSDNYHYVFPELKERQLKATFFLITNVIDNRDLMWRNKLLVLERLVSNKKELLFKLNEKYGYNNRESLSLLASSANWNMKDKEDICNFLWNQSKIESLENFLEREKPYLESWMINEMLDDGQEFDIHTASHPFCNKLTYEELASEIKTSQNYLYDNFNIISKYLSYPFGDRPSKCFEKKLIEEFNLDLLLGINDNLRNKSTDVRWERIGMEKSYERSLIAFNVKSLVNSFFLS
jgi:peptidoglycan/xylan/chitin deacetylase (PgdA/CDA1 family)